MSSPQRINPYTRQQLLVKRLALTRRQQHQGVVANNSNDNDDNSVSKPSSRRKRPISSITATPTKVIKSETPTTNKNKEHQSTTTTIENATIIDEYETWIEISTFVPYLTYGEESNSLLSALLNLPMRTQRNDNIMPLDVMSGGIKCTKCEGEIISNEYMHRRNQHTLSNLKRVLDHMLHVRNIMRRRSSSTGSKQHSDANQSTNSFMSTPPSRKKQRLVKVKKEEDQKSQSSPSVPTNNVPTTEILPWNVLLRISIRMTSHVVNQLQECHRCECTTGNLNTATSSTNVGGNLTDNDERKESSMDDVHPLLQILDIASGGLHLITRIQQQQQQSQQQQQERSKSSPKNAPSTPKKVMGTSQTSQPKDHQTTQLLPKDRMMHDWKGNKNKSHMTCPSGREIWGPSRYAFLKDVDTITKLLEQDGETKEGSGILRGVISHDEWYERVNSIVQVLDECVRVEHHHQQQQLGNVNSPIREGGGGNKLQQTASLGISPSLLRYGNKSPVKSPSLASITRAHVERVASAQKEVDRESCKKKLSFTSKVDVPVSGDVSVNLQLTMDKEKESGSLVKTEEESNDTHQLKLPTEEKEEEQDDELVDAYRMSIVFGSSASSNGEKDKARETVERRLTILVQKVNHITDSKQQQMKSESNLNVNGALSYLETLLRALVKPHNPNVWVRLLNESGGKETPIMLRRGRVALVSFLVGLKSPGWKDAVNQLESSPVPSYLGYLSSNEEIQSAGAKDQRNAIHHRSSYFLPAVDVGETMIPPSPIIVTEVGLSMCVKNFLYKDTPEGISIGQTSYQQSSNRMSTGVSIFRNYAPMQYSKNQNEHENLLNSIEMTRLSDANELTRDLFDLMLRFAADDDSEHESKPFPLRLTTPSPSESLTIVLQVVADHSDWLSPHSVTLRYRFILQHIMQSFQCSGKTDKDLLDSDDCDVEGGFASWSERASYLIDSTKTSNRGQMALYATQFMMLLCSGGGGNSTVKAFPSSNKQSHFYACLKLCQSSRFWNDIDNSGDDYSSNIMTRVFDKDFAVGFLLPLLHQCILLLASTIPSSVKNTTNSIQSQDSAQSTLSIVTILTCVLDVVADNGLLLDCVHVGWALQLFSCCVSHFTHSRTGRGTESECDTSIDSVWEDASCQLNRLYCSIWGKECNNQFQTKATDTFMSYESAQNEHPGPRMKILMPSFDVFVPSLIKFVCNLHLSADSNGMESFCKFVAYILLDRFAQTLQSCDSSNNVHQVEYSLLSNWICFLAVSLQDMICSQKAFSKSSGRNSRDEKAEDASSEKALKDLITPALKCLHVHIMQRVLRSNIRSHMTNHSPELVATIFISLYKQEVNLFLHAPSPLKTRRWGVYRKCLEQVFTLTPPCVLFAHHGHTILTEHSLDALESIWNQYGECELHHAISIMVAAGLHVNASAKCLSRDDPSPLQLKHLYNSFSSRAKDCIANTFECNTQQSKLNHSPGDSQKDVNDLIRFVRIELSHYREADVGLVWWNEVSSDLISLMEKSNEKASGLDDKKSKSVSKNIAKKNFNLRNKLSAISSGVGNTPLIGYHK